MQRREFLQCGLLLGTAGLLPSIGFADEQLNEPTIEAGDRMMLQVRNVEFPFRWCPPGTFMMGSPVIEAGRSDDERQHQVTLTRGFWMLETPVTQAMWEAVMRSRRGAFEGARLPAEQVSWDDCQTCLQRLNEIGVAPAGYQFVLPTEAQWEYACRAGTTTPFHFGNVLDGSQANCNGLIPYGTNVRGRNVGMTTEVGSYPANAWGLYDMHGNVWEWCSDRYGPYPIGTVIDPRGWHSGGRRVLRGGSWYVSARFCRSANRSNDGTGRRYSDSGVRIALVRTG